MTCIVDELDCWLLHSRAASCCCRLPGLAALTVTQERVSGLIQDVSSESGEGTLQKHRVCHNEVL